MRSRLAVLQHGVAGLLENTLVRRELLGDRDTVELGHLVETGMCMCYIDLSNKEVWKIKLSDGHI